MGTAFITELMGSFSEWWLALAVGLSIDQRLGLATTLATVLATLVAWRQLRLLRYQLWNDSIRNRREKTLDYSLVRSERYLTAREEIDKIFPPDRWSARPVPQLKIAEALDASPLAHDHLKRLLGHWENLALAISAGMADDDLAFEMVGSSVVAYVSRFREFIGLRRQQQPRVYEYLIPLVDRWETRLRRRGSRRVFE